MLGIEQVHRASTDAGGVHQMAEYPVEHALQLALTAEREGDRLEVADGSRHAAQHPAQFTHLGHPRRDPHLTAEIEAGQGSHLIGQQAQRAADTSTEQATEQQ
ncbi:hypothetical protein D3C79_908530 [compost metagenome]